MRRPDFGPLCLFRRAVPVRPFAETLAVVAVVGGVVEVVGVRFARVFRRVGQLVVDGV